MTAPQTFHDAFLFGLRDTYDAERQVARALPTLTTMARSMGVQGAFEALLGETRAHIGRLDRVFELLGQKARGTHCDRVAGILDEGLLMPAGEFDDTIDARLIASARRVAHDQMTSYATLLAWAAAMRHVQVSRLLRLTLDEEKDADQKLRQLAEQASPGADAFTVDEGDGDTEPWPLPERWQ
jgi:ferritin-like metal-binding protein YciE